MRAHRRQTEEHHRASKATAERERQAAERAAKGFEAAKARDLKVSGEAAAGQAAAWEVSAATDRAASSEAQAVEAGLIEQYKQLDAEARQAGRHI